MKVVSAFGLALLDAPGSSTRDKTASPCKPSLPSRRKRRRSSRSAPAPSRRSRKPTGRSASRNDDIGESIVDAQDSGDTTHLDNEDMAPGLLQKMAKQGRGVGGKKRAAPEPKAAKKMKKA